MVASYPDVIPSFTVKVDNTDINWAADVNRLQDEIRAIAEELGTVPKASFANVAARLQHLQNTKSDVGHHHDERYVTRSLITSKGALLVGSAAGTAIELQPGTDGQVPVADSVQPGGIRWRTLTHADLPDLSGDHHTQYLNSARHAATDHSPLLSVTSIRDLGDVSDTAPSVGHILSWTGSEYSPGPMPAHNALSGLTTGNPHTQYAQKGSAETITGAWAFSGTHPLVNNQPIVVGMNGTTRIFVRSTTPTGSVSEGDLWFVP